MRRLQKREPVPSNEFAWKVHDELSDWTARVDVKASIGLAIEAAVLGFVVTLVTDTHGPFIKAHRFQALTLGIGIACLVVGVFLAVLVVMPQLRSRASAREYQDNFIYFGHLRHWDPDTLSQRLVDDPVGLDQLSRQLVNMSRILWRKHIWLQWSLSAFMAGMALAGLSFFVG